MPTQKIFKQRVRARMTKTGESYTAARRQLLHKAADGVDATGVDATVDTDPVPVRAAAQAADVDSEAFGVSDEAMLRATGKRHAEWFAILDAWGATERGHTETARWLHDAQGVPPWWTQSVTVAYERARGLRARHQMRDGYSIAATKVLAADPAAVLAAFTDPALRDSWLPGAPMRQRPTRAALSARFDWSDPPSRVVVGVAPKGDGRVTLSVSHEQLPDAAAGERLKRAWRESLGSLKEWLERG